MAAYFVAHYFVANYYAGYFSVSTPPAVTLAPADACNTFVVPADPVVPTVSADLGIFTIPGCTS